eukprot:SAG31_NODE_2393_length_5793_cov_18.326484_8_plen_40_part_00
MRASRSYTVARVLAALEKVVNIGVKGAATVITRELKYIS